MALGCLAGLFPLAVALQAEFADRGGVYPALEFREKVRHPLYFSAKRGQIAVELEEAQEQPLDYPGMRLVDDEFFSQRVGPIDDVSRNNPAPIVVSIAAGGPKAPSKHQLHPLQVTGRLFRFQHENALTVIVLEIEVHSKSCNPYIVIVARFHQDARGYQPLVPRETVDGYRTYPADSTALDQLDHSCHAGARVNGQRAAQCLIICYQLNMAGTPHVSKMLDKFVRLHLETVDIVSDLDKAGLPYIDDPVFIQRELVVECQ
jgi:hypothetical protein